MKADTWFGASPTRMAIRRRETGATSAPSFSQGHAWWTYLAMLMGLALAGCGSNTSSYGNPATVESGGIPDHSAWTVLDTLPNASAAIDGNPSTFAISEPSKRSPLLVIDLGKACIVQAIFIEHGRFEKGHAPWVRVSTSIDGRRFTAQYEAPGTRRVTTLVFPKPALARFVRIEASGLHYRPWAIAELIVQ